MKKYLLIFLICSSTIAICNESSLKGEKAELDIKKETRELYQPMEEKVFEVKEDEKENQKEKDSEVEKQKRIEEAFILGKARVDFMKERELHLLDLETKAGIERKEEIETLDKKYSEVLSKYLTVKDEKELLILENEIYKEYLERLRVLEETIENHKIENGKKVN